MLLPLERVPGPHAGQPVRLGGAPLQGARAALVLLHGRGATAESILAFGGQVAGPDVALLAPQAAGQTWYPQRFLAPLAANEPWLSSALAAVSALVGQIEMSGLPPERVIVLGFSQGACLALEWVARHARRYGGLVGLSGGLIGPEGTPRDYPGSLEGTPVFLGCSDRDSHIPLARVQESASVLQRLGGAVDVRIYPGLGHTINDDEIAAVRALIEGLGVRG